MELLDASGAAMARAIPKVLSATFCRSVFFKGEETPNIDVSAALGDVAPLSTSVLCRAQIPHLVTLLVYKSKFQMTPDRREYFVYAPPDIKSSVRLAMQLWRRWEKPRRLEEILLVDMEDDFPKVEDAAVSEPIDDKFFDEMWASIRLRKHRAAGHPVDPFAFTSMDPDIMVYKAADFQAGLAITV